MIEVETQTHKEGVDWICGVIRQMTHPEPIVVEVGCYKGGLTLQILKAMRDLGRGKLWCVDNWSGFHGKDGDREFGEDIRSIFLDNVNPFLGKYILIDGDSNLAVPKIMEEATPVHLVYLDASHKYEDVMSDIFLWRTVMAFGGVMCGHDYNGEPGVKQAVQDCFGTGIDGATIRPGDIWSFQFPE